MKDNLGMGDWAGETEAEGVRPDLRGSLQLKGAVRALKNFYVSERIILPLWGFNFTHREVRARWGSGMGCIQREQGILPTHNTSSQLPPPHSAGLRDQWRGRRVERKGGEKAPGRPPSPQDPHPGLWCGKAAQLFLILSQSQLRPRGWGTEILGETELCRALASSQGTGRRLRPARRCVSWVAALP